MVGGEPRRDRHLRREDLKVEGETVVGERGEISPEQRVVGQVVALGEAILRIVVPMELHANTADQRDPRQPVERQGARRPPSGRHRRRCRAASPSAPLPPAPMPPRPPPVRLASWPGHRRIHDAAAGDVGEVFLDRVVAADRLIGPEDARHHRPREPRQIGLPPDVMMRVDDGLGHGSHNSSATVDGRSATNWGQTPSHPRRRSARCAARSGALRMRNLVRQGLTCCL